MIIKENLKALFWAHSGAGKTTFCAALQEVGRGNLAKSGAERIFLAGREDPRLRDIAKSVHMGRSIYRGTQNKTIYEYVLRFKGDSLAWSQPLCNYSLVDFRGGDFDGMQELNYRGDPDAIFSLKVRDEDINAIFLLFSLDQFDGNTPLIEENANKYDHREKILNFLQTVHKIVEETNIPLVIAVNHCVENGRERTELIREAKGALNGWVKRIFSKQTPNIYFIDSVEAIVRSGRWRVGISFPILDLIGQALLAAQTRPRSGLKSFVYDDAYKLRKECLDFVFKTTNMGDSI